MNENLLAVRGALSLLGTTNKTATASNVVPTSKTRTALDLLANSTAQELIDNQVNLREVTENLFNWSDKPKANKNVMRALVNALNTPGKYAHAVELTAYIVALVPLLEPDRLARLFDAVKEVDAAFAPARYTLQLSSKLKWLLARYPEERREKLAYSLWIESHQGRWWDITAGQDAPAAGPVDVAEVEVDVDIDELIEGFKNLHLPWTRHGGAVFARLPYNLDIVEALEKYNENLRKEKIVDPDIAVYASRLSWLAPLERPESPVGSLLDTINGLIEAVEYELPEKPKTFSGLFPNIRLYGGTEFPFPNSILRTDGGTLAGHRLEVVRTATVLADNRTYMGNCTWSYKGQMEKGTYVLYRVHSAAGDLYNGSLILDSRTGRWRVGEINSRYNRGQVPTDLRNEFANFVAALPAVVADNDVLRAQEHNRKVEALRQGKYRFKIT